MEKKPETVEFNAKPQNGVIKLPPKYCFLNGNRVKVVVFAGKKGQNKDVLKKYFGSVSLNENPDAYQKRVRNEWS